MSEILITLITLMTQFCLQHVATIINLTVTTGFQFLKYTIKNSIELKKFNENLKKN